MNGDSFSKRRESSPNRVDQTTRVHRTRKNKSLASTADANADSLPPNQVSFKALPRVNKYHLASGHSLPISDEFTSHAVQGPMAQRLDELGRPLRSSFLLAINRPDEVRLVAAGESGRERQPRTFKLIEAVQVKQGLDY